MIARTLLTLLSGAALIAPIYAHAAEENVPDAVEEQVQETAPETPEEVVPSQQAVKDSTQLHAAIDALIKDAPEASQKHFMALYHTHNILSVVKTVRHDVGSAVKACSENNPDMADKMNARFDEWKTAVAPVLVEAEGNINNMIIAQDYAAPQDITGALNLANKVRAKGEASVKKVPISNKEACEKLYETMASTKDKVITLMQETLVSVPHALQAELQKSAQEEASEGSPDDTPSADEE